MEKSTLSIKETLSITFRTLKILFHAAPGGIAFLGILSTIAGVCPFLTLILSRAFLDSLARACGQQAFEMEIIWLLFSLFLTNMMLSVVNNLSILLKSDVSGRISLLVNAQVLEKCVHLPMSQYDNETTYNRIRFTSEQTSIRCTNLINTFFSIVQCLISFASVVCVLVSFNSIIVIASVVASIPLFFVNKYVSSFWYKISVGRVEKQRYSDVLRDLMLRNDNIKELKLFGSLSYLKSRILNQQTDFFREDQITLPNLLPTVVLTTILSLVNSFKVFREAYLVAGNYPQESIYLLQHLFNNWFLSLDIGKLSAAAVLLALGLGCVVYLLYHFWGGGQE